MLPRLKSDSSLLFSEEFLSGVYQSLPVWRETSVAATRTIHPILGPIPDQLNPESPPLDDSTLAYCLL
ncbi:hypothetical protein QE152_g12656 [Popillia japonica]|uniref:Uncharacterized protein n=1 Tax=Popillia japonica TaxID=7064 RepID=A0AAW1LQF8_POPJA